ncbi:proline oxidase PrnD [Purpureocillium lavendulum]|uniref:Proline oxidase PrnD n=1 Tax=Purpureocillium lavendulum TaxID=1247861 RepID=A0AB34FUS6_9HYPO|nr:proline oxidase PrnD [Purpureocillium lavendulum]
MRPESAGKARQGNANANATDGDSMAEPDQQDGESRERKRDKFNDFLQKNLNKGELALKHAIGLGHLPNAVPVTDPLLDGPARAVEVGWHPVGGLAGKWFAEQTGLGKMITDKINKYPDPTQHWAVLVGEFAHQLWMDESFHVIYTNEKIKREEWQTFSVGETRFNDDAVRRAGESVIQSIREERPAYNLISNNCQTYALQLLDAIKAGGDTQFGTTLAVYERMTGPGKVMDLFKHGAGEAEAPASQDTVSLAQQVMDEHTTQLDPQAQRDRSDREAEDEDGDDDGDDDDDDGGEGKDKKKRGLFSRMLRR